MAEEYIPELTLTPNSPLAGQSAPAAPAAQAKAEAPQGESAAQSGAESRDELPPSGLDESTLS